MLTSFRESRLPLGNSFVNVEVDDSDEEIELLRAHSFAGYISNRVAGKPLSLDIACESKGSENCATRVNEAVENAKEFNSAVESADHEGSQAFPNIHRFQSLKCDGGISGKPHQEARRTNGGTTSGQITTLALQNMPSNVSQLALARIMESMGYAGRFNYVYVPLCYTTRRNRGLAIVNFTSSADAESFAAAWAQEYPLGQWKRKSGGIRIVPASVQGCDANIAKWEKAHKRHIRSAQHRPLLADVATLKALKH